MKRIHTLIWLITWALWTSAQTTGVRMMVGEHSIAPKADHFLSETKPGWKIVDIKLKDKTSHYLWGRQSGQLADSPQPTFDIYLSDKQTLVNYRIVRLKQKKQYRMLPKPRLADNEYLECSPANFLIKPIGQTGFRCTPLQPLKPGEYILLDAGQDTSDMQKVEVYAFTVANLPAPSSAKSSRQAPAQAGANGYSSR